MRIGDVPLRPGASITYLYDFGDRWTFDVRLERIAPVDRAMRKARILETHGEAPDLFKWSSNSLTVALSAGVGCATASLDSVL